MTCEDCGTKLSGGKCPNCHEESLILDQYYEQGMTPPVEDSEFMRKVREQERQIANRPNE